jgi:hypothetical protein
MAVMVNSFFEERVDRLFELANIIAQAFSAAGIEYRVVGGLAVYLYVEEVQPDAGRLTKDIDIVVRREDLHRIGDAVKPFGLELRRVAGLDMLVSRDAPSARRAVHLVLAGEKVRPEYLEPVPNLTGERKLRELPIIPLSDLVKMKLTSFRLKDQTHLKDLDEAGLIDAEVERGLAPELLRRLEAVRAAE